MSVFSNPNAIAEIVLVLLTLSMASLAMFSLTRHRIISWLFSTVISPVCYCLVFYIIGIALSVHPSRDEESVSLACSALLLVGLAKSIVCHSIPDRQKPLSASSYEQLLQMGFVLVVFRDDSVFSTLVGALFLLWVGQLKARLLSASACSRIKDDLLISEYMSRKHNPVNQDLDPTDFSSLNYIVSGEVSSKDSLRFLLKHVINLPSELKRKMDVEDPGTGACLPVVIVNPVISYSTLVTIEDIWKQIDHRSSESRDLCLSFALFKLLRRRFRGCFLHESAEDKTTQLFVRALLSSQSQNPLRAFHIIEAELGFVFDFFYTSLPNYPSTFAFAYTALTSYAAAYVLFNSATNADVQKDEGISDLNVPPLLSAIVLMFPVLGLQQLLSSSIIY